MLIIHSPVVLNKYMLMKLYEQIIW